VDRRLGFTQYTNRGLTRVLYDPEDYWVAAGSMPHDADISFLRVRPISVDGTVQPAGGVLIVPPPAFFTNPRPSLAVTGFAPDVTSLASGLPPVGALQIVVPRFTDNIRIRNTDGADELLVSFGAGQPELTVPSGQVETFYDAGVSEIFLHSSGGEASFELRFAIVNGEMA
jgi:hypothetical protein